jgi:MoxR-like ATPase
MSVRDEVLKLKANISADIIGQEEIVEHLLIAILANGNLLVEGLPGLAKTRAIKSLSNHIEGSYGRIQFTPDLEKRDITGKEEVYNKDGERGYKFMPGPIFNNVVLADEINRAPSRVQNALLEAMEERQITVAGVTYKMPPLFMVMATQNPVEQEGTYPLPEAQMDRFIMHVTVQYPDEEAEAQIIRLVRSEMSQKAVAEEQAREDSGTAKADALSQETIFAARGEIDQIAVPEAVEKYMVDLIFATRNPQKYNFELKSYIKVGASPRGSLALDKCARTYAWLHGRDTVTHDDVRAVVKAVLRHRIIRGDRALEHKITTDEIIDDILGLVQV